MAGESLFGGRVFAALLFDMDGTILSSIKAAERVWARWATSHGLDVPAFLLTIHGVRAVDTIARQNLPGVDPEQEAAALTEAEIADVAGITQIEGAATFLAALPPDRWAIVTSAPKALAAARLGAAGLAMPPALVGADDVARGKPDPSCYLLAADRLGCDVRDCLIFEDAPAGIQAAEASGGTVVVVSATHQHPMQTPHFITPGFADLCAVREGSGVRLERVR